MQSDGSGSNYFFENVLEKYCSEVLRWNKQINLVGRSAPEAILNSLIEQCRAALVALVDPPRELATVAPTFLYCDIGSGAGLPGVVWHTLLTEAGHRPQSCLIEPRGKRAWFLERITRQLGFIDLTVVAARWGAATLLPSCPGKAWPPQDILLSIKALRLSDGEVLAGLERGFSATTSAEQWGQRARRVTVVRFLPAGTRDEQDTLATLGAVEVADRLAGERVMWCCLSRRVQMFPTTTAKSSLLVSVFTTTA